jgi:phytoene dehydrogenase-like protein
MRANIAANIGLLPFFLFWALTPSVPFAAIFVALALSLSLNVWRRRQGATPQMEAAGLLLFAGLAGLSAVASGLVVAHAVALSFFVLALAAFVSLWRGKPWTADYSGADYPEMRESPVFIGINKALSSMWGVIFLASGLLAWFHVNPLVGAALALTGMLLSIFGPNLMVRAILTRRLKAQQDFDWPAPRFDAPRDQGELDVVIIGAGAGGLTTAALLAGAGLKVKVFEQHLLPGGFCHSWLRKVRHGGEPRLFRFDAGPHDFSGAYPGGTLDRLLRRLGCAGKIEWLRLDYRMIQDGEVFDPPRDWREHAEALGRRHPEDAAGILACFETMRAVNDAQRQTACHNGFSGPLRSVGDMLAFANAHPLYLKWAEVPFVALVDRHLRGAAVRRQVMAMTGYISDAPESPTCSQMAPIFGYYFNGGFYPRGGTSRFSEVLAEAIEQRGGEIAYNAGVKKILVEQGRAAAVVLDSGETVRARAIVANSDPRRTFLELLDPAHLPKTFREKLEASPSAASGFAVHLGVTGAPEGKPLIFVSDPIGGCLVVQPGLVDPSDAPPGYASVDIFTLMSAEQATKWFPPQEKFSSEEWRDYRRSEDYLVRKRALADDLITRAEQALPGLREKIVFRCEASPVTYARYDWSSSGAIYGVAPRGRMKGSKSPVRGLVVAGSMNFGPGVEAAVLSGAWAAEALVPGLLMRGAELAESVSTQVLASQPALG